MTSFCGRITKNTPLLRATAIVSAINNKCTSVGTQLKIIIKLKTEERHLMFDKDS